jgi:sn-glycerol 3-phosphate transport system permease protein
LIDTKNYPVISPKSKESKIELWAVLNIIEPYLFLVPAMLCFVVFLFYPFIKTIFLSFFTTNSMGEPKSFVGFRNYISLFTMHDFSKTLTTTFEFALMVIVLSMIFGFITANLANISGKAFKPFRIIFSMPVAVASSAVALIFQKMFDPTSGVINKLFHLNSKWFSDPALALPLTAIVTVWMMSGTNFIFLTSGLRNIPKSLYESAEMDGASAFEKLRYITIPGLSPILFFILTLNVISAFQAFAQINVMTQGGPGDSTNVIVYSIYRDAFFNFRFDFAAAQSIILFLIILTITLIQFKNEKRMVNYL